MAKQNPRAVLRAKSAFAVALENGVTVAVSEGELVHAGHEIVKIAPEQFEPVEPSRNFRVEETTAEPDKPRRRSR